MFFFFKKSRSKRKRNRQKAISSSSKKCGITREQMDAISQTIMRKKRLMVYVESCLFYKNLCLKQKKFANIYGKFF